jgi:hypothetical protein
MTPCPHCGKPITLAAAYELRPETAPRSPSAGRRGSGPEPMTASRARSFKMPYGKYTAQSLEAIHSRDPGYIEWLAANTTGSVQRAAAGFLELCLELERN